LVVTCSCAPWWTRESCPGDHRRMPGLAEPGKERAGLAGNLAGTRRFLRLLIKPFSDNALAFNLDDRAQRSDCQTHPGRAFPICSFCLHPHMNELDRFLRSNSAALRPEIRDLVEYCLDVSGKRIRPALVFFQRLGRRGSNQPGRSSALPPSVGDGCNLGHAGTRRHHGWGELPPQTVPRSRAATAPMQLVLLGDALLAPPPCMSPHNFLQPKSAELCPDADPGRCARVKSRRPCVGETRRSP